MEEKMTLELTSREVDAIEELIMIVTKSAYAKAEGVHVLIAANIKMTRRTFKVIQELNKKMNPYQ